MPPASDIEMYGEELQLTADDIEYIKDEWQYLYSCHAPGDVTAFYRFKRRPPAPAPDPRDNKPAHVLLGAPGPDAVPLRPLEQEDLSRLSNKQRGLPRAKRPPKPPEYHYCLVCNVGDRFLFGQDCPYCDAPAGLWPPSRWRRWGVQDQHDH